MSVPQWASRRSRSILVLLLLAVAAGVFAARSLPVSLFPHVNFPRIRVDLDAGDRPAERMEAQVTRPVELALRSIPGVESVESTTNRGSAEVSITFAWGQDMTAAYLQAQTQLNRVLTSLPQRTTFEVRRMDPTVFPVIAYSLASSTRSLAELRDIAQFQLLPILSKIGGVAKVSVDGAAEAEIHVTINPAQLAAHQIAISDVTSAIAAANTLSAVGRMEEHDKLYLVIADAQLASIEAIRALPLKAGPSGILTLGQIADIQRATVPQATHSTADGHDCALLNVYQQPEGNTVQIAADIRAALDQLQKTVPPDVLITQWYDQSDLITESAAGVRDAVLIGMGLAAVVLLLFLRDWRMTLIAALSVPLVLAVTVLLLHLFGQSLNIMTLGGMAAAVGLIIDDAIVMSEHLVRRLQQNPPSPTPFTANDPPSAGKRIVAAAVEFTRPLAGSSLSTIIIHIPPAFLVGVFGAFFAALSFSMASSLVVSFFVAWLVIPVLAARLLAHRPATTEGQISRALTHLYAAMLRPILRAPGLALPVAIVLCWAGYLAFTHVPSGVIPSVDEGGFVIDYVGPPGASLPEMDRLLHRVETILQHTPEVRTYSRRTGFSLGGDLSEAHTGDFFVRLNPLPRRDLDHVMEAIRQQVVAAVPGLEIEPAKLMEDLLGDLTGRPQPVVVNLFGDDESTLVSLAPKIADTLEKIPGLSSIENGVVPAGDAIDVQINRLNAAAEGFDPDSLTHALGDQLGGIVATQIQEGPKSVGVRVWIPPASRKTGDDLANLPLRAPDGHLVPLQRVASLHIAAGQPEITRLDLQRVVSITARSDRDLGTTIRAVKAALDQPGVLPPRFRYTLGGQYQEQQEVFRGTSRVILAAAALVFLLLLVLYERLRVAAAILFTTALTIAAVLIGLQLTGAELNISSMMGLVMIVGNVTEVSIFYYSEFAALPFPASDIRGCVHPHERLIAAGAHRLRAIVMTTLAAILALLPLALNWGHGGEMLKPLAIAIIAGLIVQLPLVLIGLPCWLALCRVDQIENLTR